MNSLTSHFDFDQRGIELAALFTFVIGITTAIALELQSYDSTVKPPDSFGEGATGEAAAGATWAITEVVLAVILLAAIYSMRYLPDWLQTTIRRSAAIALLVWIGSASESGSATVVFVGICVGLYVLYRIADHYGVWWIPNNLLSLFWAVSGGVMLGMLFGSVGLSIAAVLLLVYDHYFANKKDWMFALAAPIVKYRIPAVFMRPAGWRFDWGKILFEREESDDGVIAWGIGTVDMMLPAALIASIALNRSGIVAMFGDGVLLVFIAAVAMGCFRLSWQMNRHGSGAGLPPLMIAALVPYVALTAVTLLV